MSRLFGGRPGNRPRRLPHRPQAQRLAILRQEAARRGPLERERKQGLVAHPLLHALRAERMVHARQEHALDAAVMAYRAQT